MEQIEAMVTNKVKEAVNTSQTELLKAIGDLSSQISSNQSSSNEEQLCKISSLISSGDIPKFKRKSNEEQFKRNAKVLCKLEEAEKSLESRNIEKGIENVLEGKKKKKKDNYNN
ncbi:MAG: hypothetical protein AB2693_16100, partial [Candidatus Thiodiazotropha sp.]